MDGKAPYCVLRAKCNFNKKVVVFRTMLYVTDNISRRQIATFVAICLLATPVNTNPSSKCIIITL